jgi:hypothetical protein
MITGLEQALVDLESSWDERTYELWRGWAKQYADQQGEEPKRRPGNTSGSESSSGHNVSRALLPVDSRISWAELGLASIVGAGLWLALILLVRWFAGLL